MILNENIFPILEAACGVEERGRSSYWQEYLKDFKMKDGKQLGNATLPEGKGAVRNIPFYQFLMNLALTPFRRKGARFSEFRRILNLTEKIICNARKQKLVLGILRQAITLSFLKEKLDLDTLDGPIIIIGDGYGVLSSLISASTPKAKVVVVNLTPNLLIDAIHIKKSLPKSNIALATNADEYRMALSLPEINIVLVQADQAKIIQEDRIGLAINIASMQEMNPKIIAEYFYFLRHSASGRTYFYCTNRIEKILPDGTAVRFFDYPWDDRDEVLVDELCPWHQYYFSLRPPFYHDYDGKHQHRLALLYKG